MLGNSSGQNLPGAPFVIGIRIGMHKRHGDSVYSLAIKVAGRFTDNIFVQRNQYLPVKTGAFVHFEAIPGAYWTLRFDPGVGVGQARRAVSRDLQNVLEPFGNQQSNRRTFVL